MEMQTAYCAQGIYRMRSMAKNGLIVWGAIFRRMKTVGLRKTTLCVPCAENV